MLGRRRKILIFIAVLVSCASETFADPVQTTLVYLRDPVGARQIGMGESWIGLADDLYALMHNWLGGLKGGR